MLPGMDNAIVDVFTLSLAFINGLDDGSNFHKIGPCSRYDGDQHKMEF